MRGSSYRVAGLGLAMVLGLGCGEERAEEQAQVQERVRRDLFRTPVGVRELAYEVRDGRAIVEGDMVFSLSDRVLPGVLKQGAAGTLPYYRWPGNVMPYAIAGDVPNTARITEAVDRWNRLNPAVRIVPRTTQTDYVLFQKGTDPGACYSYVGRVGGAQSIDVEDGCSAGTLAHELGHALGLWHEQSRGDRNTYVNIYWENIEDGRASAFDYYPYGQDLGGYDHGSVMHYPSFAFSRNNLPTITRKDGSHIAYPEYPSAGDVYGVNALHDNSPPAVSLSGPANNSCIKGTWYANATASDNYKVRLLEWAMDGTTYRTDYGGTYSTNIYADNYPDGSWHTLTATAEDSGGNRATASLRFCSDRTPPTVALTAPAAGTLSGTVRAAANASDNVQVKAVRFSLLTGVASAGTGETRSAMSDIPPPTSNEIVLGTDTTAPYEITFDSTKIANGEYALVARAYDLANQVGTSSSAWVKVDNMVVRMTSPTEGSFVYGNVALAASVTSSAPVAKVEFFLGDSLNNTDTTAPYTGTWATTSSTSGTTVFDARVKARVTDVNGRTATSVPVNVRLRCRSYTYCGGNYAEF